MTDEANASVDGGERRDAAQARVRALAEVLLCSSVPTQMLIYGLLVAAGVPAPGPGEVSLTFVTALGLGDTVLLVALMVVLTRAQGERPADLWLGTRPPGREARLGLLLVPLTVVTVTALLYALHALAPALRTVLDNPLESLATAGPGAALLLTVVAIVAGGVREELQRAFLLVRFERHLGGIWPGVVVVSIVFGLLHSLQGHDAMVVTGVLGAAWAVVYVRRRSVVAPMISHAGFNAIQILGVALARR